MNHHVTCVCVTRPSRWDALRRAILDFAAQTYAARDLLVVCPHDNPGFAGQVAGFARAAAPDSDVRVRMAPVRRVPDGLLQGFAAAEGPMLAVWDDDNRNHPDRLAWQTLSTSPGRPTALGEAMHLFPGTGELYLARYAQPAAKAAEICAPTTLVAYRRDMPPVESLWRGHPAVGLVNSFPAHGLAVLNDVPCMHMVVAAGDNLRPFDEHRRLASGLPMSWRREWILANQAEIEKALRLYRWDGPVSVCGRDAQAFEFDGPKYGPDLLPPRTSGAAAPGPSP